MIRNIWVWAIIAFFLVGQLGVSPAYSQSRLAWQTADSDPRPTETLRGSGIETSANSCIVYFTTDAPSIKRVDVCSNQALADFNASPLPDSRGAQQLRLLSDGGMLVADNSVIVRLDAAGNMVRIFDSEDKDCWSGITVASDEQSFWGFNSCDNSATRFNIETAMKVQAFSMTSANRAEATRARMFGGGTEFTASSTEVHHGMDLHCDAGMNPNYLQVVWGDFVFAMTALTSVACTNDPTINSGASFNTISGTGIGTLNGLPGVMVEFTFTDAGQPSVLRDNARIVIRAGLGMTALEVNGRIFAGTHIARDQ